MKKVVFLLIIMCTFTFVNAQDQGRNWVQHVEEPCIQVAVIAETYVDGGGWNPIGGQLIITCMHGTGSLLRPAVGGIDVVTLSIEGSVFDEYLGNSSNRLRAEADLVVNFVTDDQQIFSFRVPASSIIFSRETGRTISVTGTFH